MNSYSTSLERSDLMRTLYGMFVVGLIAISGCGEYKAEKPVDNTQIQPTEQQGSDSKAGQDKPAEGSGG